MLFCVVEKFNNKSRSVNSRPWLAYRNSNFWTRSYKEVPDELQKILDIKFNFMKTSDNLGPEILKFVELWLNPKTRKLAELLRL